MKRNSISANDLLHQHDNLMRDEVLATQKSLLLDEMSKDEIEQQNRIIEYWIDEIQENAMADVPIFIFFCTNKKQQTFIDKILADRDQENNESEEIEFKA